MASRSNIGPVRHIRANAGKRMGTFTSTSTAQRLKAARGGSATGQAEVAQAALDSGDAYLQTLQRLNNTKTMLKTNIQKDQLKQAWLDESRGLQSVQRQLTAALPVRSVLQELSSPAVGLSGASDHTTTSDSSSRPGGNQQNVAESPDQQNLAESQEGMQHDCQTLQQSVWDQLQQLRDMLRTLAKRNADQAATAGTSGNAKRSPRDDGKSAQPSERINEPSSTPPAQQLRRVSFAHESKSMADAPQAQQSAGKPHKKPAILARPQDQHAAGTAIAAELLLAVRDRHSAEMDRLAGEERRLAGELAVAQRAIAQALRTGEPGAGNAELERDFLERAELMGDLAAVDGPGEEPGGELDLALVRAEALERLRALLDGHSAHLATLRENFLSAAGGEDAAGSVEAAEDKNGGWDEEDHFRFAKVLKGAGGRAPRADLTLRQLELELPHVPPKELQRHRTWHTTRTYHAAKRKDAAEAHHRGMEQLVAWAKEAGKKARTEAQAAQARAMEWEEQEQRRAALGRQLSALRRDHAERLRREQELADETQRASDAQEAQAAQRRAAEESRKRQLVLQYKARMGELRAADSERKEREARAQEESKSQRMQANQERVHFREAQRQSKRAALESRRLEAEEAELKRVEILQQIASSVPYYDAILNAQAKLDHVTAAVRAHQEGFMEVDKARGHHPMFGYDNGTLFKDARFRMGLALREAGVSHTKAAHEVVMRMAPRAEAPYHTG